MANPRRVFDRLAPFLAREDAGKVIITTITRKLMTPANKTQTEQPPTTKIEGDNAGNKSEELEESEVSKETIE